MKANLSITFRNVGVRKAENIQKYLTSRLLPKYNIKSAGYRIDNFDVLEAEILVKNVNEKDYIKQYDDYACQLITLINACIYKTGKSPLKYKSKKFYDLIEECCGCDNTAPPRDIDPALKKLNLELIYSNRKTLSALKKWIINNVEKGEVIDFCLMREKGLHSCLIVGYNKELKSFKVINALLNTKENAVEYLTWGQLTNLVPKDSKPDVQAILNTTSRIFFYDSDVTKRNKRKLSKGELKELKNLTVI